MDSYSGRDLVRYLGSVSSAVGVMLFFLGAAGLLVSIVTTVSGLSWLADSKAWLAVPVWSVIAVPLGLALRRGVQPAIVSMFGSLWLALALGALFSLRYFG